jgi:cardiolipin synthase
MSEFVDGNRVVLLRNGTEFFPALQRAIDMAKHEVHLQTYIYETDRVGLAIGEALKRAAARGASVCLLLDGFGCKEISRDFVRELHEAGVDVLFYRPKVSPWTLNKIRLRRLHRKIAVIDGEIAFVGGINIIDDMNTPDHTPPRVDYAVSVEGPLIRSIHSSARKLWRRVAWASLRRIVPRRMNMRLAPAGTMRADYVTRDNVWHRRDIERAYLAAIEGAHTEIVIANSYFLPGRRFRHALIAAARRRVRIVLLLQARVEYLLLDYATRALYGQLLAAGIEIHEYQASFMHSKVAVIDGEWATVGSSNIDPFSLLLSREANIVVDDRGFATELREDLEQALQQRSHRLHQRDWQHAPRARRFFAWLSYGMIRFMLGVIGHSHH